MHTIFLRESEVIAAMNQLGLPYDWHNLLPVERRGVAAAVFRSRGDSQAAYMMERGGPLLNYITVLTGQ